MHTSMYLAKEMDLLHKGVDFESDGPDRNCDSARLLRIMCQSPSVSMSDRSCVAIFRLFFINSRYII